MLQYIFIENIFTFFFPNSIFYVSLVFRCGGISLTIIPHSLGPFMIPAAWFCVKSSLLGFIVSKQIKTPVEEIVFIVNQKHLWFVLDNSHDSSISFLFNVITNMNKTINVLSLLNRFLEVKKVFLTVCILENENSPLMWVLSHRCSSDLM